MQGGGLLVEDGALVYLINSTIANCSATSRGGGILVRSGSGGQYIVAVDESKHTLREIAECISKNLGLCT